MGDSAPLQQAKAIAAALEQLADQLRPEVIRAARLDDDGRRDLDRIEYALGTIGKVKVGANYKAGAEKIDVVDKFVSQTKESADLRKTTYEESIGWYDGITSDMFS